MNKNQKGKVALICLGVALAVLAVASFAVGIFLTVNGAKNLNLTTNIVKLVFGILLILMFFPAGAFGIYMIIIGSALHATEGSLKEGNLGKGTANMTKCPRCGTEAKEGETFCKECGNSLLKTKTCASCGKENDSEAKVCSSCGKQF